MESTLIHPRSKVSLLLTRLHLPCALLLENYLLNHLINLFADQTVETINNFAATLSPPFDDAECVPKMKINISLTH